MQSFSVFVTFFNNTFGSCFFLLPIEVSVFCVKNILLFHSIKHFKKTTLKVTSFSLIGAVFFSILVNVAWIIKLLQLSNIFYINTLILVLIIRISWAGNILFYQFLLIFLESLLQKKQKISKLNIFLSVITSILSAPMLFLAFKNMFILDRPEYEFKLMKLLGIYCYVFVPLGIFLLIYKVYRYQIPKILKGQVKTIILGILVPELVLEFLQIFPFQFTSSFFTNELSIIGLSATLTTFLLLYCAKRIIKLRFLNLSHHTEISEGSLNFLTTFKDILEQLSQAAKLEELNYISENFFFKAFKIESEKVHLIIRNYNLEESLNKSKLKSIETIEKTISTESIIDQLKHDKLFILDEIEFSHFYNQEIHDEEKINFLKNINSELFIPIFHRNKIIAYIIIEKGARKGLFSKIEYDQIIIFTNYLANVINFLQNRSITSLIKNEKDLKEELYFKHQEIKQYKESIRSFLKSNQNNKIDIVIYKNRHFNFINNENEIIPRFITNLPGHPVTKKIKALVNNVTESRSLKSIYSHDNRGEKNIITGVPISEHSVLLIAYYLDVSDVIKGQLDLLKDPTKWDYLLYLETTESGKLINKLIPGNSETILNFKIELLKTCLGKKAILLQIPDEDLEAIVEIIHEISLREVLQTLDIKTPENNFDIAIKLFGINPIFGINHEESFLKKLNETGTLFIKNIHLLSLETQQYLAEFLKYGFFHVYKSNQKVVSDVRIICSTSQNLNLLVQEGKFSKELFNELKYTELKLPSLLTLPENELKELIDNLTEQNIHEETFKNILELSDKEKIKIIRDGPISLNEFKIRVHNALIKKSKKINIYQETEFNKDSQFSDPILIRATKLGKNALKDPEILTQLWNKFKNQNKIATFLGVNRSSVNRRCKEFNLK